MKKCNIYKEIDAFFKAQPSPPFLGIDWGSKRIGVAVSDKNLILASPLKTINRIEELDLIIKERKAGAFIIGYPLEMSGNVGESAKKVEAFAENLSKLYPDFPILLIDERLSSSAAEDALNESGNYSKKQQKKKKESLDKTAAAFILQGVLDSKPFKN